MQASINNNKKINCSINCNQNVNCSMGSTNNIQANTCAQNDINANSTQRGPQGIPGEAATIQLGTVTTGAAGSDVIITNSGTENAAVFNFTIPRGDRGEQGEQGIQGETGNGIVSIDLTSTSGLVDTYTITFDNGNTETFTVTNGQKGDTGSAATISVGSTTTGAAGTSANVTNSGTSSAAVLDFVIPQGVKGDTGATGNGISSIVKTSTSGLVDTYTITFTNGTITTFTVTNGQDGTVDQVFNGESANAQSGIAIQGALDEKQGTLVAGDNIEIVEPAVIRVPEGYTQLFYIYSSRDDCINTGLRGNIQWEIVAQGDTQIPATRMLVSCTNSSNNSSWFGQNGYSWGTGGSTTGVLASEKAKIIVNFNTNNCTGTVNDVAFSYTAPTSVNGNWFLLGSPNGSSSYLIGAKLFSAIARQNGVIVFDGVPAKRNSDDMVGMYDLVSNTFFEPENGGEFEAGTVASTDTTINALVGEGVLTITQFGSTKTTFSANATNGSTCNLNPTLAPKEINTSPLLNGSSQRTSNSLLYCGNDDRIHSYTETNIPISLNYGMFTNTNTFSANATATWYFKAEKCSWTVPTALRTFTSKQKVYAKCTYPDSNGNVYFVGVVGQANTTNTLEGGYTYYYLGIASSTGSVALNVSGSHFISIDTNGNLTHIDGVEVAQPESGSSRNIGEIVSSTLPLTDAGLHLLDGALIQGDGIYADFVDYIAGLDLTANYFCTETEWQQSVTDYGVCGKFVNTLQKYAFIYTGDNSTGWYCNRLEVGADFYTASGSKLSTIASINGNHITIKNSTIFPLGFDRDTANDVSASVRLPKITGLVEGTTDLTALGDLVQAGLPNITGSVSSKFYITDDQTTSGVFKSISGTGQYGTAQSSVGYGFTFDASQSSSIYGNSTTVQPQTIKAFYYIVIATSTKTDVQVDIDNIATDLNAKADTDLNNITDSAKVLVAEMGAYSPKFVDLTLGASGATYTAPATGYFSVYRIATAAGQNITISYPNANGSYAHLDGGHGNLIYSTGTNQYICFDSKLLKKGQQIKIEYTMATAVSLRFYYVVGSESEV